MNRIIEIIPTLCFTSFGFFSVYRFTSPFVVKDINHQDIYTLKLDRIINTLDSKLK